ncbi:MAG: thiosulfate oxidation carrier protein SoxY, partial [Bradyrhizobium sp.]|nr:thiosulfate oxidation carrier protein SoxY [Bradyrhizobium sp.]
MGAINRRQAFLLGGGFVALTVLPMAANAEPSNDAAELIKKFTGGKEAAKGKITLDLPEIAENGNTV